MQQNPVLEALQNAVKGLLYISETEAPLEPFAWEAGEMDRKRLLKMAGADKGTAIEETTLDRFFRTISKEDKPRFDRLANVLKDNLTDVTMFKIGDEAERLVYVVGKMSDGGWAGIKTVVVET
jgi:hypothetical protein